jgi:hypothetical protein
MTRFDSAFLTQGMPRPDQIVIPKEQRCSADTTDVVSQFLAVRVWNWSLTSHGFGPETWFRNYENNNIELGCAAQDACYLCHTPAWCCVRDIIRHLQQHHCFRCCTGHDAAIVCDYPGR